MSQLIIVYILVCVKNDNKPVWTYFPLYGVCVLFFDLCYYEGCARVYNFTASYMETQLKNFKNKLLS